MSLLESLGCPKQPGNSEWEVLIHCNKGKSNYRESSVLVPLLPFAPFQRARCSDWVLVLGTSSPEKKSKFEPTSKLAWFLLPKSHNEALLFLPEGHSLICEWCFQGTEGTRSLGGGGSCVPWWSWSPPKGGALWRPVQKCPPVEDQASSGCHSNPHPATRAEICHLRISNERVEQAKEITRLWFLYAYEVWERKKAKMDRFVNFLTDQKARCKCQNSQVIYLNWHWEAEQERR